MRRFQDSIIEVEKEMERRNANPNARHRYLPYQLLMPHLDPQEGRLNTSGPVARGVPNSVSI